MCIKETKKEVVGRLLFQALQEGGDFKWIENPSVNSVGGLVCIWNGDVFVLRRS